MVLHCSRGYKKKWTVWVSDKVVTFVAWVRDRLWCELGESLSAGKIWGDCLVVFVGLVVYIMCCF